MSRSVPRRAATGNSCSLSDYNNLRAKDDIISIGCWTHCRHHLAGVVKISNKAVKAHELIKWIAKLYQFDKKPMVLLMNDLYRNEYSLLQNYFCPTMKLISKERINSKYRKKYDAPKTPYYRLFASEDIPLATKQSLTSIYETLNPFVLRKNIETKLKNIFKLINSQSR